MSVGRRPVFVAPGIFIAAWLPLSPALSGVAVWLTSRRATAAFTGGDERYFVSNWTGPAAGIAVLMGVACVALSVLIVAALPRGGVLASSLAWCAVLCGWLMARANPISVNWGGDPDGYSLVRPYLAGWLEPALTVHLVCLALAAVALTAAVNTLLPLNLYRRLLNRRIEDR